MTYPYYSNDDTQFVTTVALSFDNSSTTQTGFVVYHVETVRYVGSAFDPEQLKAFVPKPPFWTVSRFKLREPRPSCDLPVPPDDWRLLNFCRASRR